MDAPDVNSKDSLVQFFGKHFVNVVCLHEGVDSDGNRTLGEFHISGFVVRIDEICFWVTAKHVLDEIEAKIINKNRQIIRCGFIDQWGEAAKHIDRIPYDFQQLLGGRIDRRANVDCAVVPLERHYMRLMLENGVVPIEPSAWKSVPACNEVDFMLLLGIPQELKHVPDLSDVYKKQVWVNANCTLHRVDPLIEPPFPHDATSGIPLYFGRIHLVGPMPLSNIGGMSGGPLFVLKQLDDGSLRYWLAGIQRGWFAEHNIICATPFEPIGNAIEIWLKQQKAA